MAKVYCIKCREVGVECDFEARGSSIEAVIELCAEHGSREHGMQAFSPQFYARMRQCLRVVEEEATAKPDP